MTLKPRDTELRRIALYPAMAGVVALFLGLYWILCTDVFELGEGPRGPVVLTLLGLCYLVWLARRQKIRTELSLLVSDIKKSFLVLSLGVLGGRVFGSLMGLCLWDGGLGAIGGFFCGLWAMKYVLRPTLPALEFDHLRGTSLQSELNPPVQPSVLKGEPLRWSGELFPANVAPSNFLVVGAQGTGKTLMHRELMYSIIERGNRRLLIYDLKQDLIGQLYAWGLSPSNVIVLNPFDQRATAWDIASDLHNPLLVKDYAEAFVPTDPDEPQKYFTRAAQAVLAGVLEVLIRKANKKWTLRDLINITSDEALTRCVLNQTPSTALVIKEHFGRPERVDDVRSTLSTFIGPLKDISLLWEGLPVVSLADWAKEGDAVLVMGTGFENVKTTQAVNRVMFNFLANKLTSTREQVDENRTWIFVDELKEARRLDGLNQLLSNGRSKGIRIVLGFQDLEGLKSNYGEHLSHEIMALCLNQTFLCTGSPLTAEWANKRIGDEERREKPHEPTAPAEARSEEEIRRGEHIAARPAAYPSEIMGLPLSKNGVVEGYHIVVMHPDQSRRVRRSAAKYPFFNDVKGDNFQNRTELESLEFKVWNEEDATRLGIDCPEGGKGEPESMPPTNLDLDLDSFKRIDF